MIKTLIRFGLLLVVGILVYNFFFGNPEEKESSRAVFKQTKELVGSVVGLLSSEKDKFDEGKYDKALDNIGEVLNKVEGAVKGSEELVGKVNELTKRKDELQRMVSEEATKTDHQEGDVTEVNREMEKLLDDTKSLINEADSKKKK